MRVPTLRLRHHLVCICMALLAAVALASCGKGGTTGPKEDDGCCSPDTPDNLMKALACAYQTEDMDAYGTLLHDDYLFGFVIDVADSLGLPPDHPWWGKTNDVSSTANLFADDDADFSIEFIPVEEGWTPGEISRGGAVIAGLFRRYVPNFTLAIEKAGEPITMVGGGTYLDVVVVPHPLYAGYFAVLEMEEVLRNPATAPLHVPVTLSQVKALYE